MTQISDARGVYRSHFDAFEQTLDGAKRSPLHLIRRRALAQFTERGFPTMREEDWKYTDLSPLTKVPFRAAPAVALDEEGRAIVQRELARDREGHQLVFVNGRFASDLSSAPAEGEAVIGCLRGALQSRPEIVAKHLARHAPSDDQALVALNTAFIRDGAFLQVPDGVVLERPVHLLYLSVASGEPGVSHPRTLIVAGKRSQLRVVESYLAIGEGAYFTNAVTEIAASEGAVVDHCRVQRENEQAYHMGYVTALQGRDSMLTSHVVSLGGALVRNDVSVLLAGEGSGCTVNGLYMTDDRQHVDNHTVIDHAVPHCSSNEVYKGILDGKSRAVFNGEIIVRADAQKTDAHQLNKNLVLSEDALINTKPRLRINANDVKCTHGATVGMLSEDSLFYLRSRGFPMEEARNMLTYAFAAEIIEPIRDEELRLALERMVISRLPAAERLKELA